MRSTGTQRCTRRARQRRDQRGASLRVVGLALSVVTAIVAIVVVVVVLSQRQSASSGGGGAEGPPDVEPIDVAEAGRGGDDPMDTATAGAMNWTSQNEAGEIVQEFGWERLDPLEAGRFYVTEPRARFYLDSGETVYVEAATGRVHRPANAQTLETGTFSGGVLVRVYEGHVRAQTAADPIALLQTESIDFDFTIGRLATKETVYLTARRIQFEGTGLDLLYNEVESRIEKLAVEEGKELLYLTGTTVEETASARATSPTSPDRSDRLRARLEPAAYRQEQPQAVGDDASETPSNAPVDEDFYRIRFSGDVAVRQATRVVTASNLTALVHLVDGDLALEDAPTITQGEPRGRAVAEAAHAGGKHASSPSASAAIPSLSTQLASLLVAQTPAARMPALPMEPRRQSLLQPHEPQDLLRINWTGPLSVRPLETKPDLLAEDAAHVLFEGKPVTLRDESAENEATCGSLEYFATREDVALRSSLVHPVTMRDRNGSLLTGPQFELSLRTGLGRLVGAGRAVQGGAADDAAAPVGLQLHWTDRLLVRFDVADEALRDLREAICEGGVQVDHEEFRLTSDWLRLGLEPGPGRDEPQPRHISAKGTVHGIVYGSGELKCEEIDAELTSVDGGDPFPTRIEVRGDVFGEDDLGRTMRAAAADLRLAPAPADAPEGEQDEPRLERFHAWGAGDRPVEIDDGEELAATGSELFVEEDGARITMLGAPAVARRPGATVRGPELRLDEAAELLIVEGAGDLDYDAALADADARRRDDRTRGERLQAQWSERLIYDGAADVIRCIGAVSALHDASEREANLLRCNDLTITLAADTDVEQSGDEEIVRASSLLRLEAEGEASMEHRRYAAADRSALERLLFIAGRRLDYDNERQRLHVPTPGRLVVADEAQYQQAQAAAPDDADDDAAPSFQVGRTAFDWQGEMTFEPTDGSFVMRRNVDMRHRERREDELLVLECQELTAFTTPFSLEGGEEADGAELLRVVAEQAVYAEYGERMLIADRIDYDALDRLLRATAAPGNTVMTVRRGDIAPMRMDLFRWNLATDKVEMEGVRPIRVPRGYSGAGEAP